MSNEKKPGNRPDKIEVNKLTTLPKGDPIALPRSIYQVKLPEYGQPVKIKEEYIDELIFKLQRLKNA